MDKNKVIFRPKSSFQKDDCINQTSEYQCQNKSTLEAVLGIATIRCCTDKRCMQQAAKIAVDSNKAFTKK